VKIVLGDFDFKTGRKVVFKPIIGNWNLQDVSNDNGVRVVNFTTSKNLIVKITISPHRNINKLTWKSPDKNIYNQSGCTFIIRRWHSSLLDVQSFRRADCSLVVEKIRERLTACK
jgi:hypothetical protein